MIKKFFFWLFLSLGTATGGFLTIAAWQSSKISDKRPAFANIDRVDLQMLGQLLSAAKSNNQRDLVSEWPNGVRVYREGNTQVTVFPDDEELFLPDEI